MAVLYDIVLLLAISFIVSARSASSQDSDLGPGAGPWIKADPASQGLRKEDLAEVAVELERQLPGRQCVLVLKGGKIVHEQYFGAETEDSSLVVQSLGKTGVALLMGVAHGMGLFDLDVPLAHYGVKPINDTEWANSNSAYWPTITARHILGQVSGQGKSPPGSRFTYDSDNYIQHLSSLIDAVTPSDVTPVDWAVEHFSKVLGMPELYTKDGYGGQFSAGGGQLMTCQQIARLAQLMMNRGKWPAPDGSIKQLIDDKYFSAMVTPSYPDVSTMYGFLTWLNVGKNWTPPEGWTDPNCCFPRWGFGPTCKSANPWMDVLTNSSNTQRVTRLLGDGIPGAVSTEEAWVAMGWLASHIMVLPEREMALVTMGNTWASSRFCHGKGVPGLGYDEGFALTVEHQALQNLSIVRPQRSSKKEQRKVDAEHLDLTFPVQQHGISSSAASPFSDRTSKHIATGENAQLFNKSASCLCSCWPIQGYGACIPVVSHNHIPAPLCQIHAHHRRVPEICPKVGSTADCAEKIVRQCGFALDTPTFECESVHDDCSEDGGIFRTKRCVCTPRFWQCKYNPKPCDPTDAYYPIIHDDAEVVNDELLV